MITYRYWNVVLYCESLHFCFISKLVILRYNYIRKNWMKKNNISLHCMVIIHGIYFFVIVARISLLDFFQIGKWGRYCITDTSPSVIGTSLKSGSYTWQRRCATQMNSLISSISIPLAINFILLHQGKDKKIFSSFQIKLGNLSSCSVLGKQRLQQTGFW